MIKNIGPTDRFLRLLVGALLIALSLSGIVKENQSFILVILGLIELYSAGSEYCPFYHLWDSIEARQKRRV